MREREACEEDMTHAQSSRARMRKKKRKRLFKIDEVYSDRYKTEKRERERATLAMMMDTVCVSPFFFFFLVVVGVS